MNETTALLRELVKIQTEQTALLKKHLLRLRFSVLTLLLLTTFVSVVCGIFTYRQLNSTAQGNSSMVFRPTPVPSAPASATQTREVLEQIFEEARVSTEGNQNEQ